MKRRKASDYPPAVLKLFDGYVHGSISRREFMDRAAKYAVGGFTAAAMFESLRPDYALAQIRLGRVQYHLRNLKQASEWLTKGTAAAQDPGHKYLAAMFTGALLQEQKDLAGASAAFERALELAPRSQNAITAKMPARSSGSGAWRTALIPSYVPSKIALRKSKSHAMCSSSQSTVSLTQSPKGILGIGLHRLDHLVARCVAGPGFALFVSEEADQALPR